MHHFPNYYQQFLNQYSLQSCENASFPGPSGILPKAYLWDKWYFTELIFQSDAFTFLIHFIIKNTVSDLSVPILFREYKRLREDKKLLKVTQ